MRGKAERIQPATAKNAGEQRHDCEARRGREAQPVGYAEGSCIVAPGRAARKFTRSRNHRGGSATALEHLFRAGRAGRRANVVPRLNAENRIGRVHHGTVEACCLRRAVFASCGPRRVEHEVVWTPRMLATLATGVKGGRWHSLIDKLYPVTTLRAAFAAVSANRGAAGVDRVTIERYASDLDGNLGRLSEALRTGTDRPQAIRRHYIPKHVLGPAFGRTRGPGSQEMRPLGIPTIQDRVVQTALRMVL